MGKIFSTKHGEYSMFGAACTGFGVYAIFGVVTGSYGEVCYRALGGSHKDLLRCMKRAVKLHEECKAKDIELIHIQTKERMSIKDIKRCLQQIQSNQ